MLYKQIQSGFSSLTSSGRLNPISRFKRILALILIASITAASAKVIADTSPAKAPSLPTARTEESETSLPPLQFGIPGSAEKSGEPEQIISPFKVVQALGFCLGVFLVGHALIRRKVLTQSHARDSELQLVAKLALSPKTQLVAVKHNEQSFLLALGEERVTLLNSFDAGGILAGLEDVPAMIREEDVAPLADITDYSLLKGLNEKASNA